MTVPPDDRRFEPRPRRPRVHRSVNDAENRQGELLRILQRAETVAAAGRADFTEGTSTYDVASMAIIRLAALLERSDFAAAAQRLTAEETAAIRTARNITAHAGYDGMNDDLFWTAVTSRVPAIVRRLLDDGQR